jgi:NAD(P)-dependent dehydrogenase (short-subunit alcohol dehydrogenase family)
MRLEGRVAIVTGAGAGVGRATALRFAAEGARVALADLDAEAAAKSGLAGLTRSLATTYGKRGLRANASCLGVIATRRTLAIQENPRARAALEARTALGRIGRPEEVAAAALFLVSDDASYLSGRTIIPDGEFTIGS